jgi:metallo-beta-lactamase family protein
MAIRLHFLGGADTVTGSQHIMEAGGKRVLRDCGLYQGRRKQADALNRALPFSPAAVDSVVLSHAHMDHCGNIPSLAARGYAGPVHATSATVALAGIMLRDAARIQEQDTAYLNQKTNRKGLEPVEPLYTMADAERALGLLRGHGYGQPIDAAPGIEITAHEAGHILGAALSSCTLTENGTRRRVGFALDLGRKNLPLIRDPDVMVDIDTLVMESTYGNRLHDPSTQAERQLGEIVSRTYARGGKVMIPSFALERAQEIVFHLSVLIAGGALPPHPIYIDSPMASSITRIFDQSPDYLDDETRVLHARFGSFMVPNSVRFVSDVEESKRVTASPGPCIVIAGSGMCEHGRILHHLKHGIGDARNSVVIVGYQAEHTLGRRLVEQVREVKIFGDLFPRRAEVAVLNAFSGHADRNELIAYARQVSPRKIFLVHGEAEPRQSLAEALRGEGFEVFLPKRGDVAEL